MTWTAADFAAGEAGPQFQELSDRLTVHGVPISDDLTTLRTRVQTWQLREGYKGTKLGQAADGFVGPKQIQQLWLPPKGLDRIDRTNWKITNPDGTEVKQPEFELYHNKPWFWEDENGDQVFRAPTSGGGTTSDATIYFRSETREMENSGRDKATWSSEDPRIFKAELAFTALPHVKQHAVAFQIHQGTGKVIMGRLEESKLFIESPFHDDVILSRDYQLGTFFNIEVRPGPSGILVVHNGVGHLLAGVTGDNWFYKYGCYCQARAGQEYRDQIVPKDSFAETRFRAAEVTHG